MLQTLCILLILSLSSCLSASLHRSHGITDILSHHVDFCERFNVFFFDEWDNGNFCWAEGYSTQAFLIDCRLAEYCMEVRYGPSFDDVED